MGTQSNEALSSNIGQYPGKDYGKDEIEYFTMVSLKRKEIGREAALSFSINGKHCKKFETGHLSKGFHNKHAYVDAGKI